jgi:hypothetical protein
MAKLPEIQVFYHDTTGEEVEAHTKQAAAQELSRVLGCKVSPSNVLSEAEWRFVKGVDAMIGNHFAVA